MRSEVVNPTAANCAARRSNTPKEIDEPAAFARYQAGESALVLAQAFGVHRSRIARIVRANGGAVRGGGAANLLRFSRAPVEQRLAITAAAHAAVRGRPVGRAHQLAIAESRATGRVRIGAGEVEMIERLRERGHVIRPQAAIDVYNVDLLIDDSVVVEMRNDTARPTHFPAQLRRLEKIRSLGWPVLYICFRAVENVWLNFDHIIADIDALDRLPTGVGEYRMVWCGAERFARFRNELGQIAYVPTPVRPVYRTRESDLRVAR